MILSVGGGASGYSDGWTRTEVSSYQIGGRQHYEARKQWCNRNELFIGHRIKPCFGHSFSCNELFQVQQKEESGSSIDTDCGAVW